MRSTDLMTVVDSHIGLRPSPESAFDRYLQRKGSLFGFDSDVEAIRWLDSKQIDRGILLHGDLEKRLDAIRKYPSRLSAFLPVNLRQATESWESTKAMMAYAVDHGCIGIGTLYTYRENIPLNHAIIAKIAGFACERKLPIHIECSAPVGLAAPLRTIVPPYLIEALATAFPDLVLILSSYGGGMFLYELMPEIPPRFNRVFYDTASPVDNWNHKDILKAASKITRSERLIYGSGAPLKPLSPEFEMSIEVPTEVKRRIMGANIRRLFAECGRSLDGATQSAA
ncbi:MAG: amidohydrolase family protein [Verrucomicrobiota bacterium]